MSFRFPPPRLSAPLTERPQVVAAVGAEEGDCYENSIRNRPMGDGWTLPILRRSERLSFNLTKAITCRIHTSHQKSPTSSPTSSTMNPKRSDNVVLFPIMGSAHTKTPFPSGTARLFRSRRRVEEDFSGSCQLTRLPHLLVVYCLCRENHHRRRGRG